MTTIKAIIVEDEPKSKSMLMSLLQKFCPQVTVIGDVDNVRDAVTMIEQTRPDLVFLDIELPDEKGIYLFDYFDEITFEVIFTTAYDQYAINALRLSALDYLLKPINLKELRRSIAQFNKKQEKKLRYRSLQEHLKPSPTKPKKIVLPSKESFSFINLEDIMYALIESGYITFVDNNKKKHLVAKPFKEYSDLLESFGFVRVHRGAVANPNYIAKVIRTRPSSLVMVDGTSLPIAKSRREYLMETLTSM